MKTTVRDRSAAWIFFISILTAGLVLLSQQVQALDNDYPEDLYTREELAQMLAPIALYPDALLSQVLMAATYPIEVIEADRWLRGNPHLQGDVLDAALAAEDWDPSVKALCHFPSILALMSERIDETANLGNAFLAQEGEVMGMVQELRSAAHAQGNLVTDSRQRVIVERETIIIRPAAPQVVYVPYYDPYTIYGPWRYPGYPPDYWVPQGVSIGFGVAYWPGTFFSFTFGNWSYFDWHRHYIHIDVHKRPRYVRHDRWIVKSGRWQHAPIHRRGLAYHDRHTAVKYGHSSSPAHFRSDRRGLPGRRDTHLDRHGENQRQVIRQRVERSPTTHQRQIHQRAERSHGFSDKPARYRIEPVRPKPSQMEPGRTERYWMEIQKQQQERGQRGIRNRQPVERNRQAREEAVNNRPKQVRRENSRPDRQPVARTHQRQQQTDQAQPRPQAERRKEMKNRENAYHQPVAGRRDSRPGGSYLINRSGREERSAGRNGGKGEDGGGSFRQNRRR